MPHSVIVGSTIKSIRYLTFLSVSLPTAGTEITGCLSAIIVPLCSVKSYKTGYGTYLSVAYQNSFLSPLALKR